MHHRLHRLLCRAIAVLPLVVLSLLVAAVPDARADPAAAAEPARTLGQLSPIDVPPLVFDVCGVGPRPAVWLRGGEGKGEGDDALWPDLPPEISDSALMPAAWDRLTQRLLASPQPRLKAAGLLIEGRTGITAGPRPEIGAANRLALARLALHSADDQVMAWAQRSCRNDPSSACLGLSARHWTRQQPQLLTPWLQLLTQEPAAQAEAMHGMALARSADSGVGRLASTVIASLPGAVPPHLHGWAALQLLLIDQADGLPAYQPLQAQCTAPAGLSSSRRAECEAIGRLLLDRSTDLLSHSIGIAMGRRLGWPAEELAHLTAGQQALQATAVYSLPTTPAEMAQFYRCDTVALQVEQIGRVGHIGELALARQIQRARSR